MSIADEYSRRGMIRSAAAVTALTGLAAVPARAQSQVVSETAEGAAKARRIGIALFDGFETLDVFGPVQMWARLPDHGIAMVSADGGPVRSTQGTQIVPDHAFASAPQFDVLMVPGGMGTRRLVDDARLLDFVRRQDVGTTWTTSVCTGAAILARAGVLDGRRATTNKRAFDWVRGQSDKVAWQGRARWVVDGKYITSSGVSAGTDMALALVEQLYDRPTAVEAAARAEYAWNDDPDNDSFAVG
ncbi:DJ-1/PfpI family protein [Croceibacterium sp. TMG7-5b_MA50]|uniref:DJ-1/PfpI family protein n=1 Tax=Croceibacterium sp. TMG7-5b_MA50 TaxID=3121290 RepID=UPI003221FF20